MGVQGNVILPTVNATGAAQGAIAVPHQKHSTASAHKATIKTTTSLATVMIKQAKERLTGMVHRT